MKHQYFGDISDYKKYSLLNDISDNGKLQIAVAWLLTSNDYRNDGNINKYLLNSDKWRPFEPGIFDFLHHAVVVRKTKNLRLVEEQNIVPNAKYFWEELKDNLKERNKYFKKLKEFSNDSDIVFLDPDNGIATRSIIKGRKNSSKYVFWDEILSLWNENHSLLIYQHFPRVNRVEYIRNKIDEIYEHLRNQETYAIKTTHMVYFLIPQKKHSLHFKQIKREIESKWNGIITVEKLVHDI